MTVDTWINYRHPQFKLAFGERGRATCALDAGALVINTRAWKKEEVSTRLMEFVGLQRRTDQLYLHAAHASDPAVAAQIVLDKRSVRIDGRHLVRGLAREAWTHSEASYWQRHWGQQGVHFNFNTRPVRAPHAKTATIVRFSGGQVHPWYRRCREIWDAPAPATCGRAPPRDCAHMWWSYLGDAAIPTLEAVADPSGASLQVTDESLTDRAARRPCVAGSPAVAKIAVRKDWERTMHDVPDDDEIRRDAAEMRAAAAPATAAPSAALSASLNATGEDEAARAKTVDANGTGTDGVAAAFAKKKKRRRAYRVGQVDADVVI